MSFAAESRERVRPVLPLAGMVDVLFLLLIFFMTASVFREAEQQIAVALPAAETGAPGAAPTQIVVTVTADNRLYLGARELTLPELGPILTELAEQFPQESLEVRGDENSRFGLAVEIMDTARDAGIAEVSVRTVRPAATVE